MMLKKHNYPAIEFYRQTSQKEYLAKLRRFKGTQKVCYKFYLNKLFQLLLIIENRVIKQVLL